MSTPTKIQEGEIKNVSLKKTETIEKSILPSAEGGRSIFIYKNMYL